MPTYTDYFDQPVAVGDEIVYPKSSGTSRACFDRYSIVKIIPLVLHRDRPLNLMRDDQGGYDYPTDYGPAAFLAPEKRFVVQVQDNDRYGKPRKFTIRFTDNIIKVP